MPLISRSIILLRTFKFDYVKYRQPVRREIVSGNNYYHDRQSIGGIASSTVGKNVSFGTSKKEEADDDDDNDEGEDENESKNVVPPLGDGVLSIDASQGEGGGQILRNAISYANILRVPIHVFNIRAGRSKPGLGRQHQMSIRLATKICGGTLHGHKRNATEIYYEPAELQDVSNYDETRVIYANVRSAGSVCLLLQAALPCALFCPTKVSLYLKGGTNADMAPSYEYWKHILLPTLLAQCNLETDQIESSVLRRGFYPVGRGQIQVNVRPISGMLYPITMKYRGRLKRIVIYSFHAGLFNHAYAHRMTNQAILHLQSRIANVVFEKTFDHFEDAFGNGAGIILIATFDCGRVLAGSALAKTKKDKAHLVGAAAAEELYQNYHDGGCVDEFLQDQLIVYTALAKGVSEFVTGSLTRHTQTAIKIAEQIVGAKFEVIRLDHLGNPTTEDVFAPDNFGKGGRIAGKHLIRCHGIGFERTIPLENHSDIDASPTEAS